MIVFLKRLSVLMERKGYTPRGEESQTSGLLRAASTLDQQHDMHLQNQHARKNQPWTGSQARRCCSAALYRNPPPHPAQLPPSLRELQDKDPVSSCPALLPLHLSSTFLSRPLLAGVLGPPQGLQMTLLVAAESFTYPIC